MPIMKKTLILVPLFLILFISMNSFAKTNEDYEQALKSFYDQKYTSTIIHLKNSLRTNDAHIPSHILLAKTLIAQGNGMLAETELEDLQSMGVDFNQLVTLFGQAYILQDKYQKVIDVVTSGYRGNDIESQIFFIRGQAYIGLKQDRFAEVAFTQALQLKHNYPMAKLGFAQVMIRQNQLERAERYVDEALTSFLPLPNAWIMKSIIFQMQGKFEQALTAINKALELSPDHMQARLNRASLLLSKNDYQQAVIDIDFILEKIPAEPRAKYLKAIINAASGDDKGSTDKLNEIIVTLNAVPDKVMENNPSYYYLAGLTNFQFGHLNDAKRYLHSFLKQKENDLSTLYLLALIATQQGDFLEAKSIATKANVYFPDQPNILTLLGNVAMELGQIEKASRYFERVVALAPNYSPATVNLARSEMASGNYEEAIKHLLVRTSVNKSSAEDAGMTLLLIESYIKSQQFKKAVPLTTQLVKAQPKNSYFHQQHGIALGFSGDIPGAKSELNTALKLAPNNIEAIIHLSRMDVIEKNYPLALQRLKNALIQTPENIVLAVELGDVYNISGDKKSSHNWYEKAFSFDNKNSFALKKLIASYVANKEMKQAETVLTNYLSQQKDNSAQVMLGKLYLTMNQVHKAINAFKTASNNALDRTQVYMYLANAQLKINDRHAAIKSLNKAIALDPERLEPLMMLFPITLKQKDEERAKQLIYSIGKLTPKQPLADILSAKLAMQLKHYSEAEIYFKKVLVNKNDQSVKLGLFQALSYQGKHQEAGKQVHQWIKSQPNDVLAQISLAENLANLGELEKVRSLYKELLKTYQGMPILLNNAANILYHSNSQNDKQQALYYAQQAYKKVPENVDIIDTLAWIESRNGNYPKALSLFRDALVIDFNNPEIKYHLAITLAKQERMNEAQKLLIEAVQSDRDFSEKEQAQQLLKKWLKH